MEETESQIAKILLGNNKSSNSFVYTMAEKAPTGDAELYVVAELPLFNPAAQESCERICLAIASTLKRAYKKQQGENTFENAISLINEELGKLASMGQTQWIDKLNCILGVKEGKKFSTSSCGKVSSFLLRNKEFTDISCSQTQSHPLKTFENYAVGRVVLGDLMILSTTQLFNYISMDRLLKIVSNSQFLTATQTIIELLKENAGPEISFGVLFNLQVPEGQTPEEEIDLENYVIETAPTGNTMLHNALNYVKTMFALGKDKMRKPKTDLPRISVKQRFLNLSGNTKNFMAKSQILWQGAKNSAKYIKTNVRAEKFKQFSPAKKFLMISALVLMIAVAVNIFLALRLKKISGVRNQVNTQLKDAENLISNAQASLLYKDDSKAAEFMKQAQDKMPQANIIDASNKELYNKVSTQLKETLNQMEKLVEVKAENLGPLGQADFLIKVPGYLGVQINGSVISYNLKNGKIEDSALKLNTNALASVLASDNSAAIYETSGIRPWTFQNGNLGTEYSQNVPGKDDFGGMAFYPVNNRVYVADRKSASIISYAFSKDTLSKPVVSVKNPGLSEALDIAIDTNIYVLSKNGVNKFQNGKLADFSLPALSTPFSGKGKIFTSKDYKYIYILDSGNNRIIILDKKGGLVSTIISSDFKALKDFSVDEQNKTIFLLNELSLIKINLP